MFVIGYDFYRILEEKINNVRQLKQTTKNMHYFVQRQAYSLPFTSVNGQENKNKRFQTIPFLMA
jgi:hypothetical protein